MKNKVIESILRHVKGIIIALDSDDDIYRWLKKRKREKVKEEDDNDEIINQK